MSLLSRNDPNEPSIPCKCCRGTGKIIKTIYPPNGDAFNKDIRCPICNGERITYDVVENLVNYINTVNLNVPDAYRAHSIDISMIRMRDEIYRLQKELGRA